MRMRVSLAPWNRVVEIGNWTWVDTRILAGIWRQGLGVQLSHPIERSDRENELWACFSSLRSLGGRHSPRLQLQKVDLFFINAVFHELCLWSMLGTTLVFRGDMRFYGWYIGSEYIKAVYLLHCMHYVALKVATPRGIIRANWFTTSSGDPVPYE